MRKASAANATASPKKKKTLSNVTSRNTILIVEDAENHQEADVGIFHHKHKTEELDFFFKISAELKLRLVLRCSLYAAPGNRVNNKAPSHLMK